MMENGSISRESPLELPKRTLQYACIDGQRKNPFGEELELASLYTLAEARKGKRNLSSIASVNYPLQIRRWKDGLILVDLLGINKTSFTYDEIPEVDKFIQTINSSSEYPSRILEVLKNHSLFFKDFTKKRKVTISGLIVHDEAEDLKKLLDKTIPAYTINEKEFFYPILKEKDVENVLLSLNSLHESLVKDIEELGRSKNGLMDALDISKKVLHEEIENIKESNRKAKDLLEKNLKAKKNRLKKKLDIDIAKLRAKYKNQSKPLREKRTKFKRRLTRLQKKVESKGSDDLKNLKSEMEATHKRVNKINEAIKKLEAERDAEIKEIRADSKSEIERDSENIKKKDLRTKEEIQEKSKTSKNLEKEVKNISKLINSLIRKKEKKLVKLSDVQVNLKSEEMELHVPFYLFQYGKEKFDFYPPVIVSSPRGIISKFKMMLADNMESRVSMFFSPLEEYTSQQLNNVIKCLGKNNELSKIYRKEEEKLNLFRSRRAVDNMMTGLVKMRKDGWINDSEYIRLQINLVNHLSSISMD